MAAYQVGEALTLAVSFQNALGAFFDPTTVAMKSLRPGDTLSGTITLTRDSTGNYHGSLVPDAPGRWYYRVTTTGPSDAREASFVAAAAHAV